MALSDLDKKILQEIVTESGKCLNSKRCAVCPFRAKCLPEFLNEEVPTESQRMQMALDVLTHHALIDEEMTTEDLEKDYEWHQKRK